MSGILGGVSKASRVDSYDADAPTPGVDSAWEWQRGKPSYPFGANELVIVTEVKWNGEEWWVRTRGPRGEFWNDLTVFWENATHP